MPFALWSAPATFQRALVIILNKYTGKSCLVYLDDIIIFFEDNDLRDIENVLSTFYVAGVSLKLKKCH